MLLPTTANAARSGGTTIASSAREVRNPAISRIQRGIVASVPWRRNAVMTMVAGRSGNGTGGNITSARSRWRIACLAISEPISSGRMSSKYCRIPSRVRATSAGSQVCSSAARAHSSQYCDSSSGDSLPGPYFS